MPIVQLEQGSKEWLEFRRYHITSTDAAPLMGACPWRNEMDVWNDKMGNTPNKEPNESMKRGTELEPIARRLWTEQTGLDMIPCVIQNDEYAWIATSLDGLNERHKVLIEIKCASHDVHEMAKMQEMPFYYYWQMMHHFLCTGLDDGWYISYRPEDEEPLVYFQVKVDLEDLDSLLEVEKEFWKKLCDFEQPVWTFEQLKI